MGINDDSCFTLSIDHSSLLCFAFSHIYEQLKKFGRDKYELVLAIPHNMTSTQVDYFYNCANVALAEKGVHLKTVVPEPICAALYCFEHYFHAYQSDNKFVVILCEKFERTYYLYVVKIHHYHYSIHKSKTFTNVEQFINELRNSSSKYPENCHILTVHFTEEEQRWFDGLPQVHHHQSNIYAQGALLAAHYFCQNQDYSCLLFKTQAQSLLSKTIKVAFQLQGEITQLLIRKGQQLPYRYTHTLHNGEGHVQGEVMIITDYKYLKPIRGMTNIRTISLFIDCWKNVVLVFSGTALHVTRFQLSPSKQLIMDIRKNWIIDKKEIESVNKKVILLKRLQSAIPKKEDKQQRIALKIEIENANDGELIGLEKNIQDKEKHLIENTFKFF